MRRVYQAARRPPAALLASALVAAALLVSCRDRAPEPHDRDPRPAARAVAVESILGTRSFELVAVASSPARLVANERAHGATRAVAVPLGGGKPVPLLGGGADASRALAALPGGQVLIEEIANGAERLLLVAADGRRVLLAPLLAAERPHERFLAVSADGRRFWSVARAADGAQKLIETLLPSGARRAHEEIAPPFSLEAISPDGTRAALRRSIDPESDEIVLAERATGEMRLLLPDGEDGRFRPLELLGTDRLLLLADDAGDRARLEILDLDSGRRRRVVDSTDCDVTGARRASGAGIAVDLLCRGRRETRRVELSGREQPLPEIPAPLRATAFRQLPGAEGLALELAGATSSDLWTWTAAAALRPLTYGLAPALDPDAFAGSESVAIGGGRLSGEFWIGQRPPRAGLVWLEDGSAPPRWGELPPALAALVHQDVALLRFRARGAEGFGRRFRLAAGGDPAAAIGDDLDEASRALVARLPPGAPIAIGAEGGWEAAALLAKLADPASPGADRYRAAVAFFPATDPFAVFDRIATVQEPEKSWLLARWGDPAAPGAADRRQRWRVPVAGVRVPALLVLDLSAEASGMLAAIEAARSTGRALEVQRASRSRAGELWPRPVAAQFVEFLERHLFATQPTAP